MKRLVIGILAHVDSGKTTLSEAMLYRAGALRKLGRVDHRNAFLDTDALERARGITIFSKQAVLKLPDTQLTLLDTPGHVDFSAEAERALQVMDYAILVVSGTDGVQSHTETLWRLLERYHVPVFLFVNKMDLAGADKAARLEELRREDPLPPPEQDREQSKARVLAGVKRQLRRKKLCFSARVLAGAAALGVAVWLLVFRFQTPIPYSQDIRIQEVEPAFHMKYLGRDYAGLEVLFRVTEEGGETIRRVYLCYTGSLWTRYLSPGSPYHESVGINNGIVLDTRHGTVIPLPFDGGADQVWYLAGDLEELEDLDEASFQAQAGDAVLLWERQG